MPQAWIWKRLEMRSVGKMSQQVRRFDRLKDRELPEEIRNWRTDKKSSIVDWYRIGRRRHSIKPGAGQEGMTLKARSLKSVAHISS